MAKRNGTARPSPAEVAEQYPSAAHAQKPQRPLAIDPNQDYSIDETAVLMVTSRSGVYREWRAGRLKIKKRGRRSRVAGSEIIQANARSTP